MFIRCAIGGVLAALLAAGQTTGGGRAASERLQEVQREAEARLRQGRVAEALALLESELTRSPEWKEGWWTLGWGLYRSNQHEKARPVFVRLVRMDPSKAASWLMLGLCEFQAGDFAMALDDLQRGRAMGIPTSLEINGEVALAVASAQIVLGKYERAEQTLETAAREGSARNEVSLAWGIAALRLPVLPSRAREVLDPAQIELVMGVGDALWLGENGKPDEVGALLGSLAQRRPGAPRVHAVLGEWRLVRGDKEGAAQAFQEELANFPKSARARIGLGWLAYEGGDLEAAKRYSSEAVAMEPENATAHYLYGRTLLSAEEPREALRALERGRALEPASARIRYALSRAYAALGQAADAEREMREFERLKAVEKAMRAKGRLSEAELRAAER
jgi:tetratricopeptide (TPR) repeat protein